MPLIVRENPDKWARNVAASGPSYKEGTANPHEDWEPAAKAGEDLFGVAMGQAITNRSREKGIERAGQARYDTATLEKGIVRFAAAGNVPSNKARYKANFGRFAAALRSVDLPPKQPKGQNLERVAAVNDAMIAEKARG